MTGVICAIFFFSGASALIFESLWFHQAGLVFGNGVWASSLVLASFMAGLALGNAGAAKWGVRLSRPVRAYALLELAIGASGLLLVIGLPLLVPILAPLLRSTLDQPWLANPIRVSAGFALMLLPSTAMGATLPLLVKALLARDSSFGSVLGRLYGWNTLGAVAGALATEAVLLGALGVAGSALFAAGLNVAVALAGIAIQTRLARAVRQTEATEAAPSVAGSRVRWLLAAAFLSGFSLLALEVIWFRFLQLWVHASSLVFAVMLAVVLGGIAIGSLIGGAVLRRIPGAYTWAPVASLVSGAGVVGLYAIHGQVPTEPHYVATMGAVALRAALLMAPVCLLSGVVFTWLGTAIEREIRPASRAAGWMTFWNTLGAGAGPLVAGFILLPSLGMERSFALLAMGYGAVAALAWWGLAEEHRGVRVGIAAVVTVVLAAVFPYGQMNDDFVPRSAERYVNAGGGQISRIEEGRTETIVLLENQFEGETVVRTLLTNGHSMTGDAPNARRYMNLYAYFPVFFHPKIEDALLISYGLGNTARALLDSPEIERVDIVDISREMLGLADHVFPADRNPLTDPRVHVHIDDGRYFLQVTDQRFDVITGEPPPPKNAGVVNLYTQEYFQLAYDRLAEGGMQTYWLPIHDLTLADAKGIVAAYCAVFDDCSLWLGTSTDWMLVGSRDHEWKADLAHFERAWSDPVIGPDLRAIGLEEPALLAATFLMDASQLQEWSADTAPLVDDRPKRLANLTPLPSEVYPDFEPMLATAAVRERFAASEWVASAFSPSIRARALELLDVQRILNDMTAPGGGARGPEQRIRDILFLLEETEYETIPLWDLGSNTRFAELADASSSRKTAVLEHRGYAALARREYGVAADAFRIVTARHRERTHAWRMRVLALCLADRIDEATQVTRSLRGRIEDTPEERGYWAVLRERFGLESPFAQPG